MKNTRSIVWRGRFPENDILSLLDVNRRFNLAESTSRDLHFEELIDIIGTDALRNLKLGYGRAQGDERLLAEIAAMCDVSEDAVLSTNGTALGLYLLAVELCRPGDDALIFVPCFPPSKDALLGSGVNLIQCPLRFEDGYQINLTKFEAALTPQTKLVNLATPQNPSGVLTPFKMILVILEIMDRICPDAWLLVDETYLNATYGASPIPKSAASLHPRVITGSSISKAFGAPGLRVGWLTVPDQNLLDRLICAKMNIVISGSPLNEALAAHMLRHREAILQPRRELLGTALSKVENWQTQHADKIAWVKPDSGALCCMKLNPTVFDDAAVSAFWNLLSSHNLQLGEGSWFGEDERVFRLGFGYLPLAELESALLTLGNLLEALSRSKAKQ